MQRIVIALVTLVACVAIALSLAKDPRQRKVAPILLGCAIGAGIFGGWTNAITMGWF